MTNISFLLVMTIIIYKFASIQLEPFNSAFWRINEAD